MATPTRELTITYGSTVVGGNADTALLTGPVVLDRQYGETVLTFDAVVSETSESAFGTTVAAMELAFTTPRQALTITQGGETLLSMSHSGNTGFNAEPTINMLGHRLDSGRSRRYTIRITFTTPAFLSGVAGRLIARERLTVTPAGTKTLQLTGTYTALAANGARAQYEANIATYEATAQTNAGGGTWEPGPRVEEVDDEGKVLTFDRTSIEVNANQSVGTLNDTDIKMPDLRITRRRLAPGDSRTEGRVPRRLMMLNATYSCWLDKAQTTDLTGTWLSKIRPHIINRVATIAGTSNMALVESAPQFNEQENSISATMSFLVVDGSNVVQARDSTDEDINFGDVYTPVWDGNRFAVDHYPGPTTWFRVLVSDRVLLRKGRGAITVQSGSIFKDGGALDSVGGGVVQSIEKRATPTGFVEVRRFSTKKPFVAGIPGTTLELVQELSGMTIRRVDIIEGPDAGTGSDSEGSVDEVPA